MNIKRAHPAACLPAYATGGAACFDLPLARYEPDTVYIGNGEYVAECVRADDGDYYLAADVDAAIEALRAEVERLNRILGRIVEGDGDSTLTIRAGADAFAAAREYLSAHHNRKRIAWQLERTAMGDGYYGDALRAAKEFPEATPSVQALLDRWITGKQNGLSDRTDLCTFALQIYMSDLAKGDREKLEQA